ncbi:MAG: hypothetical protein WCA54_01855, partial [Pseudolabrys sp.]
RLLVGAGARGKSGAGNGGDGIRSDRISVGLLRNFYFATFFGFDVEERAKSFDYSSAGSSRFVFHSCDAYGMVVNRYLFGMTNPHERNRCCDTSRAKDEPGH